MPSPRDRGLGADTCELMMAGQISPGMVQRKKSEGWIPTCETGEMMIFQESAKSIRYTPRVCRALLYPANTVQYCGLLTRVRIVISHAKLTPSGVEEFPSALTIEERLQFPTQCTGNDEDGERNKEGKKKCTEK